MLAISGLSESAAQGQSVPYGVVRGTVTDVESGLPIAGAHAFIGQTLIGTVTDRDGVFELRQIPEGHHDLWISMVGYEPTSEPFAVTDTMRVEGISFEMSLEPTVVEMGEVTVTGKRNRRWKKRLARFKKLFLGETLFSDSTFITNTETLDFDSNWLGRFNAEAQDALSIDNQALGYHVTYVLKDFQQEGSTIKYDGDPLFEDLALHTDNQGNLTADSAQIAQWMQNREVAFNGSFHHFLLALLEGITKEEGFKITRLPTIEDIPNSMRRFRIDPDELIVPGDSTDEKLLSFVGVLEIVYTEEKESHHYLRWSGASHHKSPTYQTSWIRLTSGPTAIDPNGEVIDPYGVTVYGYYAYERIAHEVPKEYRPERWE